MNTVIVATRIAQYLGGAVLFGAPLFMIYAFPQARALPMEEGRWLKSLTAGSAALVLVAAIAYLFALTANLAGDPAAAFDPEMLKSVLIESAMGWAISARWAAAAAILLIVVATPLSRAAFALLSLLGAIVLLSFAWTGHGAAQEGAGGLIHLAADLLHLLAAGVWIGALVSFALLLNRLADLTPPRAEALHGALAGFSGVGSGVVAVIVATGIVNSWFLVGPNRIASVFTNPYGLILLAKLVLFAGMLLLAARNRFTHTPALARNLTSAGFERSLRRLRASILLETALAFGVLALVGVLGTMAPIASE